jgi:hypothetical protein
MLIEALLCVAVVEDQPLWIEEWLSWIDQANH